MIWMLAALPVGYMVFKELFTGFMKPEGVIDVIMLLLFGTVMTGMVVLAGVAVGCLIGAALPAHPVKLETRSLIAIRDKDGVEGQFFLGSGFIKSDQYYFYYEKMPDGGVRPGKVFAGNGVRIYEEDRSDATLTVFDWVVDSPLVPLLAFPVHEGGRSYNFHVPRGTVRPGYTM